MGPIALKARRARAPRALLIASALLAGGPAAAGAYLAVRPLTIATRVEAYARVEPIASLPVRAAQPGVIAELQLPPGSRVRAGEALAQLRGPEIDAQLVHDRDRRLRADARLAAARKVLAEQRALAGLELGTHARLADAESGLAVARSAADDAIAAERAALSLRVLRAPAAGTLLAWNATDGERVAAGQAVITLQADDRLWLKAEFYGTEATAVRVGMRGRFVATDGSPPVPVEVVSVFPTLAADGGEAAGLRAASAAHWRSGEFGTVTLDGPARRVEAVPSRALILDRGRWWVMLHTPHGDRPRAVVPGPVRGWDTLIESGLSPGAEVVVDGAYLEFHHGIARSYQPPD